MLMQKIFSQDGKGTMSHLLRRALEGAHPRLCKCVFSVQHSLRCREIVTPVPNVCMRTCTYFLSILISAVGFFFQFDGFPLCIHMKNSFIDTNYIYISQYKKLLLFHSETQKEWLVREEVLSKIYLNLNPNTQQLSIFGHDI